MVLMVVVFAVAVDVAADGIGAAASLVWPTDSDDTEVGAMICN
jgi:hypothetical protein